MESSLQDNHGKKIYKSIKDMIAILSKGNLANILDVQHERGKEHFELLNRLERGVDQFNRRGKNLFYIGVLGHYSAGKSSVINSILGLEGTKDERKTDPHPTDDQITLLTNHENNDEVIRLMRHGKVPVGTYTLEHPFLKDKVIMDTPGTGDPSLYEQLVRDTLPLYDLIIYCISGANPLDSSDIPFLREKERNLNDIPTLYVVTRAEEFKMNRDLPLCDTNFDTRRSKNFLAELSARMREDVSQTIQLDYEDFILIDNKAQYGIDRLKAEITKLSDTSDPNKVIKLHSHKISFFLKATNDIKKFFSDKVNDKLQMGHDYFGIAQTKIKEYDEQTIFGIDVLITNWKVIDINVKKVLDGALDHNTFRFKSLEVAPVFASVAPVTNWNSVHKYRFERQASSTADRAFTVLTSALFNIKETFSNLYVESLEEGDRIDILNVERVINGRINEVLFETSERINLVAAYGDFFSSCYNYLAIDVLKSVASDLQSFEGRIKEKKPLASIFPHIEEAKSRLKSIFGEYKKAVKMCKVAAFSDETKSYIKNLGLSEGMDVLDAKDIDITPLLVATETEIFDPFEHQIRRYQKTCEKLEGCFNPLPAADFFSPSPEEEEAVKVIEEEVTIAIREHINRSFQQNVASKVMNFYLETANTINDRIIRLKLNHDAGLEALRRRRTMFYIKCLIPAFVFFAMTIAFFLLPSFQIKALSLGWQYVMGVLTNLGFTLLSTSFARKRDEYPRLKLESKIVIKKAKKEVVIEELQLGHDLFHKSISDSFKTSVEGIVKMEAFNALVKIQSRELNAKLHEMHKMVYDAETTLKNIIGEYNKALSDLKNVIGVILNDSTRNRGILARQAEMVKRSSIEESFNLLSKTQLEIAELKKELQSIEFA